MTDLTGLLALLPHAEESGVGLAQRFAYRNGLRLKSLLKMLGLTLSSLQNAEHSDAVAGLLSASTRWLVPRLAQRDPDSAQGFHYLGTTWSCRLSLRGLRPQACPRCLIEDPFCRCIWEVTGVAVCTKHRIALIGACHFCRRRLSWDRPAPGVCSCGRQFASKDDAEVDPKVVLWCRWVEHQLREQPSNPPPASALDDSLPSWLSGLSVDGAFHALWALGVRQTPHQRVGAELVCNPASPRICHDVVARGLSRADAFDSSAALQSLVADGLFYEQGMARLARLSSNAADRSFAAAVRLLGRESKSSRARLHHLQQGQLELFEG